MRRWFWLLAMLLAPAQAHAAQTSEILTYGGVIRSFELRTIWEKPQAIVVALHPRPASGRAMRHISRLDSYAEAAGVVVVYPDAVDRAWNAGECCGDSDDLGFVEALVIHLRETLSLPDVPAYVVGVSNGAAMAERLLLERPGLFAGGVLVSGAASEDLIEGGVGPAVPILVMIGRDDAMRPRLEAAVRARERRRACLAGDRSGGPAWERETADCEGVRLETWRFEAGHVWPGAVDSGPLSWPEAPFDAGEEALRFLGLLPSPGAKACGLESGTGL